MRTPTFHGRPMKMVKKYENFILFMDEKTGVKECYSEWTLTHSEFLGRLYSHPDEEGNYGHHKKRGARPCQKSMNDKRLQELMKQMAEDVVKKETCKEA